MKKHRDEKKRKGNSIANGFKKLAIAAVIFGILYVLFFTFYWPGNSHADDPENHPKNPYPLRPTARQGAGSGRRDRPAREKAKGRKRTKARSMNRITAARRRREDASPHWRPSTDPGGTSQPADTRPNENTRRRPRTGPERAQSRKTARTKRPVPLGSHRRPCGRTPSGRSSRPRLRKAGRAGERVLGVDRDFFGDLHRRKVSQEPELRLPAKVTSRLCRNLHEDDTEGTRGR